MESSSLQAAETSRYFEAEQNELSVCTLRKIVKKVCLIGVRATTLTLENKKKNRLQCLFYLAVPGYFLPHKKY